MKDPQSLLKRHLANDNPSVNSNEIISPSNRQSVGGKKLCLSREAHQKNRSSVVDLTGQGDPIPTNECQGERDNMEIPVM